MTKYREMKYMHDPLFLENPEKKGMVVFIHGFMGSPRQFDNLAQSIHSQGYSVASLLLPGHGATVKEFSSSTAQNWQHHVCSEVEGFSRGYNSIYLVGHSMGCLLAINTAIRHSGHVRGLFLIACPLKLKGFSLQTLKIRLKQVFYRKNHPMKSAYLAGSSVPPSLSLIWRSAKPGAELKKLMLITEKNLQNIRVPVTAIFSSADELVSMDSLEILKTGLNQVSFDSLTLSDSLHAYYPEHEQSLIEGALFRCIYSVLPLRI